MQNIQQQTKGIIKNDELLRSPLKSKSEFTRNSTDNTETAFTEKMKDICLILFQKSSERLKRSRQEHNFRKQHNKRIMNMIQSFSFIRNSKALQQDLNLRQISQHINKSEFKISRIVNHNLNIKKTSKESIQTLAKYRKERLQIEKEYSLLKKQNFSTSLALAYLRYLQKHCFQSQKIMKQLANNIIQKQKQIKQTQEQTKRITQQYKTIEQSIQQKQKQILQLFQQLQLSCATNIHLSKEKIPNQKEMINCMFLVGILSEQNLILYLNKNIRPAQKAIKFHPLLSRRQIIIDCQNSQIIELKIITAIYMHCKTLLLSNIVTLMKTLSFFSDQLRSIYSYKSFQKYLIIFMEKVKLNIQWIKIKEHMQIISKEMTICKKKLFIYIKSSYFSFLKQILQILRTEDRYEINIGNFKMIIELKQQEQQNKQKEVQNLNTQYNQLILKLHKCIPQ